VASCAACGNTIIFGGVTAHGRRFCKEPCRDQMAGELAALDVVPEHDALDRAQQIRGGPCPGCGQPGEIEVRPVHRCISYLIGTNYSTRLLLACAGCASRERWKASLLTALFGWWGFPWGLLITPVQLARNALARGPSDPTRPSPELVRVARLQLASERGLGA